MEYSPEQLLGLWKKGKSLNNAIWHFCNSKNSPEYLQPSINKDLAVNDLLAGVSATFHEFSKQVLLEKELTSDLIKQLRKETLIGIGYEPPIKSTSFPIIIPSHVWDNPKMEKTSVSGNGLDFLSVRIIRRSALNKKIIPQKENPLPKYKIEKKPQGRPSIGNIIIEAYHLLDKDGQIDATKPFRSHYDAIRAVVRRLRPDLKDNDGMEDEAIRKRVTELFKAKKKSHKLSHKL